jgi:hypothetical protein
MATPANVIHVPRPSPGSFDKNRPLSRNALLQAQVQHFQEAERHLPPERQSGIDPAAIRTEGEAAEYVRRITFALHPEGARREKVRKAT